MKAEVRARSFVGSDYWNAWPHVKLTFSFISLELNIAEANVHGYENEPSPSVQRALDNKRGGMTMAQGQGWLVVEAYPNWISWAQEIALSFRTETSREIWNRKCNLVLQLSQQCFYDILAKNTKRTILCKNNKQQPLNKKHPPGNEGWLCYREEILICLFIWWASHSLSLILVALK